MNVIGLCIVIICVIWFVMYSTPNRSVWEDMVSAYPSIRDVRVKMPEYYDRFEKALIHADMVQRDILKQPLHHTRLVYLQVKDVWLEVLRRWEQISVAPGAVYMLEEVAAGTRVLLKHVIQRLEEIRAYDTSPYRTVWIGLGQPRDPYDSHTVSFV